MNLARLQRITIEEGKCGGRPCIRGLRMGVTDVLELLGSGASFEEILEELRHAWWRVQLTRGSLILSH